jgi:sugar/nucleoside kinase (ribokinase family)
MSSRNGLLAGGNWIVDAVKMIDVWPQQDALANIHSESRGTGGSPFNVLVDLAIMGCGFALEAVGLVGNDAHGRFILNTCHELGIQTQALQITPDAPTSFTDVMTVASTGRRTFFHARGANALLDDTHFDFSKTTARMFHLGYLLLLDGLDKPCPEFGTVAARVLARARQAGLKTSIDVVSEDSERFAKIVLPALKYVDYCIMNEFEAGRVTGRSIRKEGGIDFAELKAAMEDLLAAGVHDSVLVHFPEGGCILDKQGGWTQHGSVILPEGYIKGAAGAGDAFTAGVLMARHQGLSQKEQLQLGVCAAAANLADETCTGGLKSASECLAIGARYGFRTL